MLRRTTSSQTERSLRLRVLAYRALRDQQRGQAEGRRYRSRYPRSPFVREILQLFVGDRR